jgi:hypothetical protein
LSVPATESLSQISVLQIGRPRHTSAASQGLPESGSIMLDTLSTILQFAALSERFSAHRLTQNQCCKVWQTIR